MKAAPFDYILAASLDEAAQALVQDGDDAMIIAGGQTLVPMMAMRLARPGVLIDINEIAELQGIQGDGDVVTVRGCTRQAAAIGDPVLADSIPLLAKAMPFIGHQQTRNRGTVGGSIAHGDPAAEIPLASVALEAGVLLESTVGSRIVGALEYFEGPMMTARQPYECLTAIEFPIWSNGGAIGVGFQEISERHGDFAIVAAAAQLQFDVDGRCARAAIAVGGVSGVPVKVAAAEAVLVGETVSNATIKAAAAEIATAIDPFDDCHASAGYRKRVADRLVIRAIVEATEDAGLAVS